MKRIFALLLMAVMVLPSLSAQTVEDIQYTCTKKGRGSLKSFVCQTSKVPGFKDTRSAVFCVTEYGSDKGPSGKLSPELAIFFSDEGGDIEKLNRLALIANGYWLTTHITFANGDTTSVEALLNRWKVEKDSSHPMLTWNMFSPELEDPEEMAAAVQKYLDSDIAMIQVMEVSVRPNLMVGSSKVLKGCFDAYIKAGYPSKYYVPDDVKAVEEGVENYVHNPFGLVKNNGQRITFDSVLDSLAKVPGLRPASAQGSMIFLRKADGYKATFLGAPISSASMNVPSVEEGIEYSVQYIVECENEDRYNFVASEIRKVAKEKGSRVKYDKTRGKLYYESFRTEFDGYIINVDAYSSFTTTITVKKKQQ